MRRCERCRLADRRTAITAYLRTHDPIPGIAGQVADYRLALEAAHAALRATVRGAPTPEHTSRLRALVDSALDLTEQALSKYAVTTGR